MPSDRLIRVFVSSTFRDMKEERDALMTRTWPLLRQFCRERHVEFVEVDLRWGISEEQSTRQETLKLCLDEIHACRPYFVGLVGERYGWVPTPEAFSADLMEEQPWLGALRDRSVTELEIVHGVLRDAAMHGRAFFYFRDPQYATHVPEEQRVDFASEDGSSQTRLQDLKARIRRARDEQVCQLRENYPDPATVAALVLEDLQAVIDAEYPPEDAPDALTREALDHEAFAEIRRRTYIGREAYYEVLDRHVNAEASEGNQPSADDKPLLLLGESGSGKSALLANWIDRWRESNPDDFIFQHYIGSTTDSADHWQLMTRLIGAIKRWADDPEELPRSHDDLLRTFPLWLSKARIRAEHIGARCIIVLDALNQLEDKDHARLLGWLPEFPFHGPLRLIVSTLPGDTLEAVEPRGWTQLRVEPFMPDERREMIVSYLGRFGKKLDATRLDRIAKADATSNPLFLKTLLDELRVTGTHQGLDARLDEYLSAPDIPALLQFVLHRYQLDYEHDRPGLVAEALGLIWAARRGLTESELLHFLRPANLPQLPIATWTPLRAALDEFLLNRDGILNFAHDYLRGAVQATIVADHGREHELRSRLADEFDGCPITPRSSDELPWLLSKTGQYERLRGCILEIDRALIILQEEEPALGHYWQLLGGSREMAESYIRAVDEWAGHGFLSQLEALSSLLGADYENLEPLIEASIGHTWRGKSVPELVSIARAMRALGSCMLDAGQYDAAEKLVRRALLIDVYTNPGKDAGVLRDLYLLGSLLGFANRLAEAEKVFARLLAETSDDPEDQIVVLSHLGGIYRKTGRNSEAQAAMHQALRISEDTFGVDHYNTALTSLDFSAFLEHTEAEVLLRRVLITLERHFGRNSFSVASCIKSLAELLQVRGNYEEADDLLRRALWIVAGLYGTDHPYYSDLLAESAWILAERYQNDIRHARRPSSTLEEAENMARRALVIAETSFGPSHPTVAKRLNTLAGILSRMRRPAAEIQVLLQRQIAIVEENRGRSDLAPYRPIPFGGS